MLSPGLSDQGNLEGSIWNDYRPHQQSDDSLGNITLTNEQYLGTEDEDCIMLDQGTETIVVSDEYIQQLVETAIKK